MYVILWMFYFGGQCIDHLAAFFVKSLDILIFFCHSFIVINNLPFNSRKSFQHFSQLKVNIIEWQHSRNIKTSTAAKNYIVFAILRIVIVMGLLMCSMFPKYGSIFCYIEKYGTISRKHGTHKKPHYYYNPQYCKNDLVLCCR